MANETDFLNNALGVAGCARIDNINDGSSEANWCKTFYGDGSLRQSLLRSHHWNFAESRAILSQALPVPGFEFAFAYQLPANIAKIKEYNGEYIVYIPSDPYYWMVYPGKYKIEGQRLLTNDASVLIVYVQDIDEPSRWDPLFFQTMVCLLGSRLARSVSKDTRKADSLMAEFSTMWLPAAVAVDGQEGTGQAYIVDDLIRGR